MPVVAAVGYREQIFGELSARPSKRSMYWLPTPRIGRGNVAMAPVERRRSRYENDSTKRIRDLERLVIDEWRSTLMRELLGEEGPEEFCDRVRARLVGALTLTSGDHGVAEELAQEALAQAWQRWPTVRRMDSPEAWTFRVGFNLANSWHRRRLAEWRANRRTTTGTDSIDGADQTDVLTVRMAVSQLPARQRSVIIARFYLGHDVASAARFLDCAEGTIKATTHQALTSLRASGLIDVDMEETVR